MKKVFIVIGVLLVLAGAGYYFWGAPATEKDSSVVPGQTVGSGATAETIAAIADYEYTETYTHPIHRFTFKYPKEFTVQTLAGENEGDETILIQNTNTKIGVQILITRFLGGEDIDLTADIIKGDLPDLQVENTQEVLIGQGRKGLAFQSDNPAFGGKSREVWFVWQGYIYQISTYAEFDPFLKGLFTTWQFTL